MEGVVVYSSDTTYGIMKKTRKEIIETIQLITSIVALSVTIMSLVKRFMDWSED